ncbi:uncharacterized protein DUF3618 [Nocardiopsis sp. Huas11]|uniref:DUF3618 domain-containing protein n=1 Tax=Nocardiopsis sp. Huas11 TaxID=2183912 RepID=UPI000EB33D3C|nr:DUF3618 domain-containing protein [Nocardiopsis sp. Huas11]RKS10485.1 uncharacterized protein DUF3618 [Nocardiopsis sp. Huas11]
MTGRDTEPRQTPAEVEAEINREQRQLARTLDELGEQARPANIARRQVAKAKERGTRLVDEARALVVGGAVRVESHLVEPEEGSIRLKGDDDVVTTYEARGRISTEALLLMAGIGAVVTAGVVAWAVRRKRG